VLETKPDVDKEEGFEDTTKDTAEVDTDMVKQDKVFFNREEVSEARTGFTKKKRSSSKELEAEGADTDAAASVGG
jgi:hypothetical protein